MRIEDNGFSKTVCHVKLTRLKSEFPWTIPLQGTTPLQVPIDEFLQHYDSSIISAD